MRINKFLLISFFLLLISSVPLITFAHGLVPCGGVGESPCTACDLLVLVQNVIQLVIKLSTLFIIGLFVYAGFSYMTSGGNELRIKSAQNILISSLVGLGIILSAWLIVNTVFWLIAQAGGKDYTGNWYHIECNIAPPATSIGGGENEGGDGNGNGNGNGETNLHGTHGKQNWCSDLGEGYGCVKDKSACTGSPIILNDPSLHCPPETSWCCKPLDPNDIVSSPKNPEPWNPGGPCENGQLLKPCHYNQCVPNRSCDIAKGYPPFRCAKPDPNNPPMRCPEECVWQCDTDDNCNSK